MGVVEGLEYEHPTARQQRRRQLEAGVLRGGPDQRDDAVLDPGEERVLLRPVEAVDLVAEQDRAASFVLETLLRQFDDLAHAGHPLRDRGERLEATIGVARDQARTGRLARAGRGPEEARPHDRPPHQPAPAIPGPRTAL